ncbi:MAG TPA: FAD-dependent oxidoreductase [Longilinea sp.]|nr:FAD-dependent oxidoreductase [Longilinea sp.]
MYHFRYLIIGGGMAADAAVRGIRTLDSSGTIGLISSEKNPPYNRPPLSKGLWKGKKFERIWRNTNELNATLQLGRTVVKLDREAHKVTNDLDEEYTYEKLLLATGGEPRKLTYGGKLVNYLRTLEDYQDLRSLANDRQRFAVIGGGFIGSEIAAVLTELGKQVTMVFPETGITARIFPADVITHVNELFRQKGVVIKHGFLPENIEPFSGGIKVGIRSQAGTVETLEADGVIAGLGLIPNTELAEQAGLKVDNGIWVDEHLQAGEDIYSAGDVANYFDISLQMRRRVEHEDQANTQGHVAGQNMAGAGLTYDHLPYFYTDIFNIGYEAIGELDGRMEVIPAWVEPYQKGILYYLCDGKIRGVLLWNVWGKIEEARKLIKAGETTSADQIPGLILVE